MANKASVASQYRQLSWLLHGLTESSKVRSRGCPPQVNMWQAAAGAGLQLSP